MIKIIKDKIREVAHSVARKHKPDIDPTELDRAQLQKVCLDYIKCKVDFKSIITTAIIAAISAILVTMLLGYIAKHTGMPTEAKQIADFYSDELAVKVSPTILADEFKKYNSENFILIDLRSKEEYEKGHIVTAVNIPMYSNLGTFDDEQKTNVMDIFKSIRKDNSGKTIILYSKNALDDSVLLVGNLLAKNMIYAKSLNTAWGDWKYEDYIVSGTEAGKIKKD